MDSYRLKLYKILSNNGWTLIRNAKETPLASVTGIYVYFCAGDNRFIYDFSPDYPLYNHLDGWDEATCIAYRIVPPYSDAKSNAGWIDTTITLKGGSNEAVKTRESTIQLIAIKSETGKIEYVLNWYYTDDLLGEFKNKEGNNVTDIKPNYDGWVIVGYYEIYDVECFIV